MNLSVHLFLISTCLLDSLFVCLFVCFCSTMWTYLIGFFLFYSLKFCVSVVCLDVCKCSTCIPVPVEVRRAHQIPRT